MRLGFTELHVDGIGMYWIKYQWNWAVLNCMLMGLVCTDWMSMGLVCTKLRAVLNWMSMGLCCTLFECRRDWVVLNWRLKDPAVLNWMSMWLGCAELNVDIVRLCWIKRWHCGEKCQKYTSFKGNKIKNHKMHPSRIMMQLDVMTGVMPEMVWWLHRV